MARLAQRGVILQPGAIGDCVLTLPLAEFTGFYPAERALTVFAPWIR
ncbi:MAG: hypothetical protein ACYSWZ_19455 [Planctomycetota bacterium]